MDGTNVNCFDTDTLFGHMPPESTIDDTCLNDFLLDPSPHDKISCDPICFPNTKPPFSMDVFGCSNGNMMNLPNNLHNSNFMDVPPLNSFLPNFNTAGCQLMSNPPNMMHYNNNNNNVTCNDYSSVNDVMAYMPVSSVPGGKTLQQPIMHESSTLVNRTATDLMTNFNKNVLDTILPSSSEAYDIIGNNNSGFMASPLFGTETISASKMDSDPFSPSISSSVSSIPSVEMPDKSSYVPGSVDSGVVVNGSSSSPFSTSDSNRNGECSSINDSLISPLTQGPGSERSVETTPGSESVSSEICSPRVDFDILSLESNAKNKAKPKEKSHKGRKRKNEPKKEKVPRNKKPPVLIPTYQSQISPGQNGIKLKISLTNPGPIPVNKKRRKHKKSTEPPVGPEEQTGWGARIPHFILTDIFRMVTEADGCLPSLIRYL